MTAALEGGEWSAARPGSTLPQGKTRRPFYLKTYLACYFIGIHILVHSLNVCHPRRANTIIVYCVLIDCFIVAHCNCLVS